MKIRELFIELSVQADIDAVRKFEDSLDDLKTTVANVGKAALAMAAAFTAGLAGLGALAAKESEFAEEVARNARAFKLSTQAYQELRFAMLSLNASSDDLTDILGSINKAILEASRGAQTANQWFTDLGITYQELQALSPEDQIYALARATRSAGDEAAAQAAIFGMLGEDLGRRVLPGFTDSTGAMENFGKMAKEAGLIVDDELIQRGAQAQMEFREFGAVLKGLSRQLGLQMAPAFARFARYLIDIATKRGPEINKVIKDFARTVGEELDKVQKYFEYADKVVQQAFGGWRPLLEGIATAITALGAAWAAAKLGGAVLAIRGIVTGMTALGAGLFAKATLAAILVGAALLLLVLILEDLYGALAGADSWIGGFVLQLQKAGGASADLAATFKVLVQIMLATFEAMNIVWQGAQELARVMGFELGGILEFTLFLLATIAVVLVAIVGIIGILVVGFIAGILAIGAALAWLIGVIVDALVMIGEGIGDALWVATEAVTNFFGGIGDWIDRTLGKLKPLVDMMQRIGGLVTGGGEGGFLRRLNPFASDEPSPAVSPAPRPNLAQPQGVRGAGSFITPVASNVSVGNISVNVDVPQGADVSQTVAEQTGQRTMESVARGLSSQMTGM
jgi:hypothetical protein